MPFAAQRYERPELMRRRAMVLARLQDTQFHNALRSIYRRQSTLIPLCAYSADPPGQVHRRFLHRFYLLGDLPEQHIAIHKAFADLSTRHSLIVCVTDTRVLKLTLWIQVTIIQ